MTNVTDLTSLAAPAAADEMYIVDDPAGTPLDRKITVQDLLSGDHIHGCRVYNGSSITLTNVTFTDLTFDSEDFDNGGLHSTTSDTDRITISEAGVYAIFGQVEFDVNSSGVRQIYIELNDTTQLVRGYVPTFSAIATLMNVSAIVDLAVDDYIRLVAYQDRGANLGVHSDNVATPIFSAIKVG